MNEDRQLPATDTARVDKWLWAVRLYKSRSLATAACLAGNVHIQDQPAKPARMVRQGETVLVRQGLVWRTLEVVALPRSRVGAALVPQFCRESTSPEEWAKAKVSRVEQILVRERGTGRPTKRDRRHLDRLFGQ